ncbi:hypothetical protein VTN31DRAFT_2431 [Thermomyces dupontii]|uniref:uncharacterized protein n=1 Tax=Talaromyces thermophilus TaxID=28565 RepID=UPI0037432161
MKLLALAAVAVSTLPPLAYAVGNATVLNNCTDPVYVWSVGSQVGPEHTLEHNQTYSEQYRRDNETGGITIKVTRQPGGLWNGSPQLNFGYTLDGSSIWYAIGDVNGDPFTNETVVVTPANDNCESIVWEDGVPPPGIHPRVCAAEHDVQLTVCGK